MSEEVRKQKGIFFSNNTFFDKNQIVLAEPQWSYCFFPNLRLICSYFVLVTIMIFYLALHICIFVIHAEYFWLVIGWFEEKILYFNIQIRVCHILFTDETTNYIAAEDFDGIDLILLQTFV